MAYPWSINRLVITTPTPTGTTASSNVIPGYITSGGTPIYPWDHNDVNTNLAASPIIPMTDLKIEGNIITRTLPAVTNYSDWGYGQKLVAGVTSDPAVTDSDLTPSRLIDLGSVAGYRRVSIRGNHLANGYQGILLPAPAYDGAYEILDISDNFIFNCQTRGISIPAGTAYTLAAASIRDNFINLDPYRLHANSNSNGTYGANGAPEAIYTLNCQGLAVSGNTIMNACRLVASSNIDELVCDNNLGICNPTAIGFNTSNVGIGEMLDAAIGFRYAVVDADPTSATYLDYTNTMVTSANAQPSAGKYLQGWYVRKRRPTVATGKILIGWVRITTGTGHVNGTDWEPLYGTNS